MCVIPPASMNRFSAKRAARNRGCFSVWQSALCPELADYSLTMLFSFESMNHCSSFSGFCPSVEHSNTSNITWKNTRETYILWTVLNHRYHYFTVSWMSLDNFVVKTHLRVRGHTNRRPSPLSFPLQNFATPIKHVFDKLKWRVQDCMIHEVFKGIP